MKTKVILQFYLYLGQILEVRLSKEVYNKFISNDNSENILTKGSINLERLSKISEQFDLSNMTSNSLKDSMSQLISEYSKHGNPSAFKSIEKSGTTTKKRDTSSLISNNRLYIVLKKLQEGGSNVTSE